MRVPAGQQRHGDIKCGQQAGGRALRGHVPYIVNNFYCFQGRPPLSAPGDSMPAMVCALIDELPVCRPNEPFVKCLCVKQMFSWGSPAHTTHYTPNTRHSRYSSANKWGNGRNISPDHYMYNSILFKKCMLCMK